MNKVFIIIMDDDYFVWRDLKGELERVPDDNIKVFPENEKQLEELISLMEDFKFSEIIKKFENSNSHLLYIVDLEIGSSRTLGWEFIKELERTPKKYSDYMILTNYYRSDVGSYIPKWYGKSDYKFISKPEHSTSLEAERIMSFVQKIAIGEA